MALLRHRGSLGLLCCAQAVLGLRTPPPSTTPPPKEVLPGPGELGAPSVVVGGIGDSGTSAVIAALERLGLVHCNEHNLWQEPVRAGGAPHGMSRESIIRGMLEMGHFQMTQAAYQLHPTMWEQSLEYALFLARLERECIQKQWLDEGKPAQATATWGFKEPHFGWLLPTMDAAYRLRTKYLIIARDPRDVCNGLLQDQFQQYGIQLWIYDCYTWWAKYWNELLDRYESTARMKVLRIEDLVVPEPGPGSLSLRVLLCVLNFAGLAAGTDELMSVLTNFHSALDGASDTPSRVGQGGPSDRSMTRELEGFHDYSKHYEGQMRGEGGRKLEWELANHTDPALRSAMLRLGYNFAHFGRLTPASGSVCG